MFILTFVKPRLHRVICDVFLIMLKLRSASHNMIVTLTLPKMTATAQQPVNLPSSEFLPRVTLVLQPVLPCKLDKHMHMIRHDDEVTEFIPLASEELKRCLNNPTNRHLLEMTFSMSCIKQLVKAA